MRWRIFQLTGKLYKRAYFIVFYDKTDMYLEYSFDNIDEILKFMKKEKTPNNVKVIQNELYRALKSEEHFCTFLTGKTLRVYIIKAK